MLINEVCKECNLTKKAVEYYTEQGLIQPRITENGYRQFSETDDPFLVEKLLREKEGIFLWCLEGLHRLIGNNYQFSISGKARENMETVKRSSNNVIEFLQSEGYIRFRADSEASSKAIYEAYTRWCDDNAQKPMSANRVSSELAQNERLYNVEATNNVHVGGKRVRGFVGIEVVNPLPCEKMRTGLQNCRTRRTLCTAVFDSILKNRFCLCAP